MNVLESKIIFFLFIIFSCVMRTLRQFDLSEKNYDTKWYPDTLSKGLTHNLKLSCIQWRNRLRFSRSSMQNLSNINPYKKKTIMIFIFVNTKNYQRKEDYFSLNVLLNCVF